MSNLIACTLIFKLNTGLIMRKQLALSAIILLSGIVNAQEQDYVVSCSSKPLLFHALLKF
jgi:hypothetical protein